ncbi:MAG: PhoPQ-activated pathogenicity-related family protein [Candidatus Loosdrechtia sp.]|uniref:PhoPQ-activated pathogenicity-related family protein n=1 Tax=Candidatus Loosdrechtia sp. TaxID=3101272 RepID=UPI003A73AC56|nr:MAG: PhoPQ-activated protein PqaA family protein [Candidatus Jettenia sp. AMX2]
MLFTNTLFAELLENYIKEKDASFIWKCQKQKTLHDATILHMEIVSQTWRGLFWTHHVQVVRPALIRNPEIAFLFVTGDGDGSKEIESLSFLARRAGTVAAVITNVPNQPLFHDLYEDALIAYTFEKYLDTKDVTWPLLFPMVKSVVRGMDAVQAVIRKTFDQEITRFVVSGASKRGWTTWLTAAVDPRVKAIAPMVIDMLNMKKQTDWARKMYGKQSEKIIDYTSRNLVDRMDEPDMVTLREWVDPYSYRQRYTMPKLLLLGTNDPYWVVDALRHYWDDLPEPKHVHQTPNAGHDLGGGKEAIQTLSAWYHMIADGQELPKVEWHLTDGKDAPAGIEIKVNRPVKKIRLWTAMSNERDFRNNAWSSQELACTDRNSQASALVPVPQKGFIAFMGEVELISETGDTYKLSTQVKVVPDNIASRNTE